MPRYPKAGIGDMLKSTYDSDKDGRIEKDALEIALDKLLKGAGAGSDPTLINSGVVGVDGPLNNWAMKYCSMGFDGEYLEYFWKANWAAQFAGLRTFYTLSYGTYQWKGYMNAISNITYYLGLFERHAGQDTEGAILIEYADGVYKFRTLEAGAGTNTTLSGQNWTSLKTFKVVWSSGHAYLYVNGGEVAHNTTNVPTSPMHLLLGELAGGATAPTSDCHMYIKDYEVL